MGAIQLPDSFCDPIITRLDGEVEGFFVQRAMTKSKIASLPIMATPSPSPLYVGGPNRYVNVSSAIQHKTTRP